tara:strand:- start:1214 stop:1693 length:480 start_codon:yes stop_codon:yes gene_type:complete
MLLVNNRFDKLKELNLSDQSKVTLKNDDGAEIIHYTGDDYEGNTVRETNVAFRLAELATSKQLKDNKIITQMREDGLLNGYIRGSDTFVDHVCEAICDNWYEYLEVNTEHYDHKRGFTKVEAEFQTTVGQLLEADSQDPTLFNSWEVEVETPMGSLSVE